MPNTRRADRAGARSGSLPPALRGAVRDEAKRIAGLKDPIEIITAAGDTFAGLDSELERIADIRLSAVRRLREEGWSYDRIATATGLSKGRVQQLSNAARQARSRD
jgi:DNA-directed RNA polymerase specialized sigma24 family protein